MKHVNRARHLQERFAANRQLPHFTSFSPRTTKPNFPYLFAAPRANFFTFCLFDPRGTVRLGLGAAFFRAARFTFFRSAVSVIAFVFAML